VKRGVGLVVLLMTSACTVKKEPVTTTAFGPNLPSFLTLASGHTYTVLQMGPIFGREGKLLAWTIPYLSASSDLETIRSAAMELLEVARPEAEAAGVGVVISAVLSFDPKTRASANFGVVFERKPTGWELQRPRGDVPPSSPEIPKLLDGWNGFSRDANSELAGVREATRWLQLLDSGKFDDAWLQASPVFRAFVSKEKWGTQVPQLAARAKVVARTESYRVYAGYSQDLPPATYLAITFKTQLAGSSVPVLERVQMRLEDDGSWRAIGFRLG
jgi:Protein of unknown function (DUF4019)